jgi:EpsG family
MTKSGLSLLAYLLLGSIFTFIVGTRGEEVGSDTATYLQFFAAIGDGGGLGPEFSRLEVGFVCLTKFISTFTTSPQYYLSIIFMIQFFGITSSFLKKSPQFKPYLFVALLWLSFPFFYSITLNVLRQGLAFVFVVYAIDLKIRGKKYLPYVLLLAGMCVHYAVVLYLFAFVVRELGFGTLQLIRLWSITVVASGLGLIERAVIPLLRWMVGDSVYFSTYVDLSINGDYETGFKAHFLAMSILPIIYYLALRRKSDKQAAQISPVLQLYLIVNMIFWLVISLPFNDRIAIASWLLFPLMINLKHLDLFGLYRPAIVFVPLSAVGLGFYYLF